MSLKDVSGLRMDNENESQPAAPPDADVPQLEQEAPNVPPQVRIVDMVEADREARSQEAGLRRAALKRLQRMGVAGLEPLLQLLQKHMRKRRRVRAAVTTLAWLLLPVSLLLAPGLLLSICMGGNAVFFGIAFIVWIANWVLFVMRSRLPMTARQREIVDVFADIHDLRAIGPLLDALSSQPENDPPMLRETLKRLLTQARASDAGLFTPRQRSILYRELITKSRHPAQYDFIIAILKALEQIGTTSAIPYVAELAQRTYPHPAPLDVREAAWHCLDYLRDHAGEMTTRQTLLRASGPNQSRTETLLRPAQELETSRPETLLRPDMPPPANSSTPSDTQPPDAPPAP